MRLLLDIKKKVGIMKEIYGIYKKMKGGRKMKKGFTLLELIVVIIIIGILATLGFTQYTKVIEKGRTAEAKAILGQMRTAQEAYKQENGAYTATIGNLAVEAPTACVATHYFSYAVPAAAAATFTVRATRCGTGTGKTPGCGTAYTITLNEVGTWGGNTAGYY